jgi:hypothetical protein
MNELSVVKVCSPAIPNSSGVEGHGEGVKYKDDYYYYRTGANIPHGKVVAVTCEKNFFSRVRGEKTWLLLVYETAFCTQRNLVVLEEVSEDLKSRLALYKGLTPSQAIERRLDEDAQNAARWESIPNCACGGKILLLADEQRKDECYICYKKRMKS